MYAHCARSGEIELSSKADLKGRVCIGQGPKAELEQKISARARLAHDGKTWLVPNLPEAQTDDQAFDAVVAFTDRLKLPL